MSEKYKVHYEYKVINIYHNNNKYNIIFDIKNDTINDIKKKIIKSTKNAYNEVIFNKFLLEINKISLEKKIKNFTINKLTLKCIYLPIKEKLNSENQLNFLTDKQETQLKNILFSCFKYETNGNNNININFSSKYTGVLIILDAYENIHGLLLYSNNFNRYLIENVCFSETIRNKGFFSLIFPWFLDNIKITMQFYKNFYENYNNIGYAINIWNESPFNKNNKIENIYKRFLFKFFSNFNRNTNTYKMLIRDY